MAPALCCGLHLARAAQISPWRRRRTRLAQPSGKAAGRRHPQSGDGGPAAAPHPAMSLVCAAVLARAVRRVPGSCARSVDLRRRRRAASGLGSADTPARPPPRSASSTGPSVRPAKAGVFSGRKSRRGKSQEPRSWIAERRETDDLKPIDKAVHGTGSESPGRNASEPKCNPEKSPWRPSPYRAGEGSMGWSNRLKRPAHSSGAAGAARRQGHAETGETLLAPPRNWRSRSAL